MTITKRERYFSKMIEHERTDVYRNVCSRVHRAEEGADAFESDLICALREHDAFQQADVLNARACKLAAKAGVVIF